MLSRLHRILYNYLNRRYLMDRRRDTALPSSSDDDGEVEDVDMFSPRANLMEERREESERSDSVDSESSADVIMGIIGFADPVCPPPTLVPTDVVDAPPPPPPPSTPVDTNAWGPDGTSARVRARSRAVSEGTPRGTLEAGTLRSAMPLRSPRSPLRSSRKRVGSVGSGLSEVLQDAEDAWDGVSPRDPLTLEPLCEDNRLVFEFYPPQPCLHADGAASSKPHGARVKGPRSPKSRRSGGVVIRYNLHSLLRYYTTAARLNDPVTGVPLSAQQIRALERAARRLGVDLGEGGLDALHSSPSRDQEARQQAILQNYESLGGEMIASMMEHIEVFQTLTLTLTLL